MNFNILNPRYTFFLGFSINPTFCDPIVVQGPLFSVSALANSKWRSLRWGGTNKKIYEKDADQFHYAMIKLYLHITIKGQHDWMEKHKVG